MATLASTSLGALLRETATSDPDAVAFVEGERRLTYAEWDRLSDCVAASFVRLGLAPGEVVALLLPTSVAYPICYLGAAKAGLVTAGINTRFREREVGHILDSSGASVLVTDDDLLPLAQAVRPETLRHVCSPEELVWKRGDPPTVHEDEDRAVAIVYTSGTTGAPKGATYCGRNIEAIRRMDAALERSHSPSMVAAIPLPHMGFMSRIGANIHKRARTVLMQRWTARATLEAIEREQLTVLGGIPTQLALMLLDPDFEKFDLSSLRACAMGGGPASPELVLRIREAFDAPVIVRYSCTELGLGTATRPGDPDEVVATTVGRALPEIDLRILEPNADGIGEIAVRSPAMMAGYWRDPEMTRAAIDGDGFFHTGDLGRVDEAGNLVLSGRTKEMYIRGGYNVYPVEVEAVLAEHPKIELAAVIGVPDEVFGEKGTAFVVPRDAADPPTPEELRAFVAERVADYKAPDLVEICAELPMTPMFKVDKEALAARAN
jgi:acyl-CoA synthetase (AMP-forming)/AMP-acid ligase II